MRRIPGRVIVDWLGLRKLTVGALVSVLASTVGQAEIAPIPISPTGVSEDRLPQSVVDLGGVEVRTDVTYASILGYRPLRMDVYAVPGAGPRPAIVFVHGGAWSFGIKRATDAYADFPGFLADIARQGFVVAAVEYRLSGEAPFPAAALDIKAAIRFLRKNAADFGVDPDRMGVWGGSAGAHLAGMAAMSCDAPDLQPEVAELADVSDCVQAFVGWYGPYDIDTMLARTLAISTSGAEMSPSDKASIEGGFTFFGCADGVCPAGLGDKASPLFRVDPTDPPTLLIHGTADTLVPYSQSEVMQAALKAAGVPAELILIDGVGHGWSTGDADLRTTASRQAAEATINWFIKTLQ
jgi:acetyl esterase/lipase